MLGATLQKMDGYCGQRFSYNLNIFPKMLIMVHAYTSMKLGKMWLLTPLRLLVPLPVPTNWGSACPSSSSWGIASSMPWLGMRWRRSACRGSSRLTARSAPMSLTLPDSWVSWLQSFSVQLVYTLSKIFHKCWLVFNCFYMAFKIRYICKLMKLEDMTSRHKEQWWICGFDQQWNHSNNPLRSSELCNI